MGLFRINVRHVIIVNSGNGRFKGLFRINVQEVDVVNSGNGCFKGLFRIIVQEVDVLFNVQTFDVLFIVQFNYTSAEGAEVALTALCT